MYAPDLSDCILNANQPYDSLDSAIQIMKILGLLLHVLFFVCVFLLKELQARNSVFLINISVISFMFLINGVLMYDPDIICIINSSGFCKFEGMFFSYSGYLYSYGVLALAVYRLTCVTVNSINHKLNFWKIALSISFIWLFPLSFVILTIYGLESPVYYSEVLSACRVNFTYTHFSIFITIGFVIPSLSIALIYSVIVYKIKVSKNRIKNLHECNQKARCEVVKKANKKPKLVKPVECANANGVIFNLRINDQLIFIIHNGEYFNQADKHRNTNEKRLVNINHNMPNVSKMNRKNSFQFKLIIQFLIIFITYEIFSFSNIVITFNGSIDTGHWNKNVLKGLKLLIWLYHFLNPIIYLAFHPVFIDNLKSFFVKLKTEGLCKVQKKSEMKSKTNIKSDISQTIGNMAQTKFKAIESLRH